MTMAIVATGSTRNRSIPAGSDHPSVGMPEGGRSRQPSEKPHTSRMPTQNTGTAMPNWATAENTRPTHDRL